jgi:hypothetical protein
MVMPAMSPCPAARDDVLLRRVGSEWVLFDARRDRAHVLNLTAAVVWTYLDGTHGSDAIVEAISRDVNDSPPDSIRSDVERLLARFASEGLLR